MSENESTLPLTTEDDIYEGVRDLGVAPGDTVIAHVAMSEFGFVAGGATAVVDALRRAVTDEGTLVMPTMTKQCADPRHWPDDRFEEYRDEIIEALPPFRPEVTPARGMGVVPECFRNYPDTVRSQHPDVSFAAWGADADYVVADHEYDYGLGRNSPLEKVYELDGKVLLLGVDHHDCNTSLHLAQYVADFDKTVVEDGGAIIEDGERTWVSYEDYDRHDDSWIEDCRRLGGEYDEAFDPAVGTVGRAESKLVSQPDLVDFAIDWFEEHK